MMDRLKVALSSFFEAKALNPHGVGLPLRPELFWIHAVSDLLVGAAFLSIPLILAVFLARRRDVRLSWAIWMLVVFLVLCSASRFMAVWTRWSPAPEAEALFAAAVAGAAVVAAVGLWWRLPRAIALPSMNALHARIAERDAALAELHRAMDTMVEMREHQARQKYLLDELNHRVKNTLAAVQSVAVQTFNDSHDIPQARDLFIERLMSLSATHNLLVKHEWESVDLRELLDAALAPHGRPYACEGPDLRLDANLAVSLGMVAHELAINALKHGAWRGAGRVDVEVIETVDGQITLVWRESGGPAVTPPTRRGFGSRLLEKGITAELRGAATLDFDPAGLICTVTAPASERLSVKRAQAAA